MKTKIIKAKNFYLYEVEGRVIVEFEDEVFEFKNYFEAGEFIENQN